MVKEFKMFDPNLIIRSDELPNEILLFECMQKKNQEDQLQRLLDKIPIETLINIHNTAGYSALHVACQMN